MLIQWFPGHMTKTKRMIEDHLKAVDVVAELLDARIPQSSANPMVEELVKGKPRIVILNKADLADPRETDLWISYYKKKGISVVPMTVGNGKTRKSSFPSSGKQRNLSFPDGGNGGLKTVLCGS